MNRTITSSNTRPRIGVAFCQQPLIRSGEIVLREAAKLLRACRERCFSGLGRTWGRANAKLVGYWLARGATPPGMFVPRGEAS